MNDRIRAFAIRVPVSLGFCCISFLVLLLAIAAPGSIRYIALFPESVAQGYVWLLLTYAVLHSSPIHLLVISAAVVWLGWYIEPVFGAIRFVALVSGAALGSGIAYFLLQPAPALPLIGGVFVASAIAAAFVCWSIPNRTRFGAHLRVLWVLIALWAAYTLWMSPLQLSAVYAVAWGIGALCAFAIQQQRTSQNERVKRT